MFLRNAPLLTTQPAAGVLSASLCASPPSFLLLLMLLFPRLTLFITSHQSAAMVTDDAEQTVNIWPYSVQRVFFFYVVITFSASKG